MPDSSYTLVYSQPRLTDDEPPNLMWEKRVEHYTASDDTEAFREMCQTLGKDPLSFRQVTHHRELTLCTCDHPYRVLREAKTTSHGRIQSGGGAYANTTYHSKGIGPSSWPMDG